MNARTIGDLLVDLGPGGRDKGNERVVPFARHIMPVALTQPVDAPDKVDEAYQRGKHEGHTAAWADCEAKLKEYAARCTSKMTEDRDRWAAEQANVMIDLIKDGYCQLEACIAGSVARILEPFLAAAIRRQAISEFIKELSILVSNASRPVLQISGPGDLLDTIRHKLGADLVSIEYVAQEGCEIRVCCEQTAIETQMQAWIARLNDALQ
jgi:hypothetical protein